MRRRRPVRYETRKHGVVLAGPLLRALVVAAAGIALVVAGTPLAWPLGAAGALTAVIGALVALRAVAEWERTKLVVTEGQLSVVHGLVRRRRVSVELLPGAPLEVEQSLLGRMLGYGTVHAGDLEIPHVPDPRRLRASAS